MANGDSPVPGQRIADDIGRIPGFVNSYVLRDGTETYLIDTGFAQKAKPIVRAFRSANVPLRSVGKILLTHHHVDHMGGAAFLRQTTDAPISCHRDDVAYVDGRARPPMPLLMRLFVRTHPAPVAVTLHDGDRVGPLLVVHAPGHTPGEIVLYHESRKILFSGDAVVERKGKLTMPAAGFASSLDQAVRSFSRVRDLNAEVLLPGHGEPVTRDVGDLLDDLIGRAPREFLHR